MKENPSKNTVTNSSLPKQNKDEISHWLFDGTEQVTHATSNQPAQENATNKPLDTLSDKTLAEQQLMHALLLQQQDNDITTQARIQQVMQQLTTQDPVNKNIKTDTRVSTSNVMPFYRRWISVAASIIIVSTLSFTLMLPSNDAMAEMHKVLTTIANMADRVYDLKITTADTNKRRFTHKIRPNKRAKNINKKTSTFEQGKLYLRGNNQFVLIDESPLKSLIIKGNNGKESWKVLPNGKVKTQPYGKVKLPLAARSKALTFMSMTDILKNLSTGYEFTLEQNQSFTGNSGEWSKITITKADKQMKGLRQAILYFDPDTHIMQKIVFDKVHVPGQSEFKKVTMTLLSTQPLAADWFSPNTHK